MRVGEIRAANLQRASPAGQPEPDSTQPTGRALVALEPVVATQEPRGDERQPQFGQASFLVQLIATKDQHPQTRERRRAEPADAIAAYRVMAKLKA